MNWRKELEKRLAEGMKADVEEHLKESFREHGIEYTEQMIERSYSNHPTIKNMFLYYYHGLIRR